MDKYEYKVRADEIKELIAKRDYAQAAEIADSIDWRRVKSVMMLCTISDLYKINRRYEDARDMLLLAYERRPGGRNICYSLCELSIKTGEFVQAMEYYKEFVQVAPKDPGRYILQYKLYVDQDVSLEERIAVLEELKKHDYREKWAYELAYLYHRVGLATQCVEECDEIILWFGEGEYVTKAMELKMLHQPLTAEQQEKYDHRLDEKPAAEPFHGEEQGGENADEYAFVSGDTQIYEPVRPETDDMAAEDDGEYAGEAYQENSEEFYEDSTEEPGAVSAPEEAVQNPEELDIQVKTMDVGQYNTINLQAELAQGLRDLLSAEEQADGGAANADAQDGQDAQEQGIENPITRSIVASMMDSDTESLDLLEIDEVSEEDLEPEPEEIESSEVFFGETGEIVLEQMRREDAERAAADRQETAAPEETVSDAETPNAAKAEIADEEIPNAAIAKVIYPDKRAEREMARIQPPKELANVLSQESDGQISLVIPDSENVEKQITGQMNIQDVLAEWERMKKENEEKRKEEVRQHVLQQTGSMFTEFEAAVRDGLLEQLEKSAQEPEGTLTESDAAEEPEDILTENDVVEELEEIAEAGEVLTTEAGTDEEEIIGGEITDEETFDEVAFSGEADGEAEPEGIESEESEETEREAVKSEAAEPEETAVEETASEETAPEETAPEETAPEEMAPEELTPEETEPEEASFERAKPRSLTREERELYSDYIQSRSTKEQIVRAVDSISLAAYTGNVIITGEAGMDTITLAKNMIREVQATDSNFSGKVAKISGQGLNRKNVGETLNQLQNGALIVQNACDMDENTVQALYKALQKESLGIVVLLQDDTKVMNRFLKGNEKLLDVFTARVDVEALSNDMLVAYGKQYAKEQEYSIDELGTLALHNRIEERQTIDHAVTTSEVQEIVDEAIRHANRRTLGHFFDVLLSKRYDEEDMIVVTEKDFE